MRKLWFAVVALAATIYPLFAQTPPPNPTPKEQVVGSHSKMELPTPRPRTYEELVAGEPTGFGNLQVCGKGWEYMDWDTPILDDLFAENVKTTSSAGVVSSISLQYSAYDLDRILYVFDQAAQRISFNLGDSVDNGSPGDHVRHWKTDRVEATATVDEDSFILNLEFKCTDIRSLPTPTPRPTATPKPCVCKGGPCVLAAQWSWSREHGFLICEGMVKNRSRTRIPIVEAFVIFKTSSGDYVKRASALIDFRPLMPGQESPFRVTASDNPAVSLATVRFTNGRGGVISACTQ